VGVVSAELFVPGSRSLKDKRMVLRKVRDQLSRRCGASVAEIGYQDLWQRAQMVIAVAASDPGVLGETLATARGVLEGHDWVLVRAHEEVIEVDA
jgi:uncharacterized protein YlxP (DUF503 family)